MSDKNLAKGVINKFHISFINYKTIIIRVLNILKILLFTKSVHHGNIKDN